MTRPAGQARVPVVVGLRNRVGAGTVAAALHADEAGPGSMAADVAVCAGDDIALRRAESLCGAPVLLVVLVDAGPPPSRARLRELGRRHGAVAVLPHVPHWAALADVPDEAAAVLARHPEELPPVLRAYAGELRQAVRALLCGGGLGRASPPAMRWAGPERAPGAAVAAVAPADRFARGRLVLGASLGDAGPGGRARRRVPDLARPSADVTRGVSERQAADRQAPDDDTLEAAALAAVPPRAPRPAAGMAR